MNLIFISSFPSGHALSTSAFATALTLIATRIWPPSRRIALPLAVLWIGLMGLSRLVLGVHWPADVLAAVCLGLFIPLAISLFLFPHVS
jgi:undecaprenyl-diphosphatase